MIKRDTDITREQQLDLAYKLMVSKADMMELKFGERTNTETIKEGRINFSYKCWFCNDDNKITTRIITVTTKGF